MKKMLVFLLAVVLFFSGCIGQQNSPNQQGTVKVGDKIVVDYTGRIQGGEIFDTSIESVAKQNGIYNQNRTYGPLNFTVGKGEMIKGFDEGVVGMKVGETKTITIPPEKGYGPIDPNKIQVIPIIQSIPAKTTIPRNINVTPEQFNSVFGSNHSVGDTVNVPDTNINLTVINLGSNGSMGRNGSNISLKYNFMTGDQIRQKGIPWNETVTSADDTNITVKIDVNKNDIIKLPNTFWNSTVIDVNETNITLKHIAMPDKEIPSLFGPVRVHFNDTDITIDQNNKLAGKTLIFEVTVKSIGQ